MNIDGTRFGSIEIEEAKTIELPAVAVTLPGLFNISLNCPGALLARMTLREISRTARWVPVNAALVIATAGLEGWRSSSMRCWDGRVTW